MKRLVLLMFVLCLSLVGCGDDTATSEPEPTVTHSTSSNSTKTDIPNVSSSSLSGGGIGSYTGSSSGTKEAVNISVQKLSYSNKDYTIYVEFSEKPNSGAIIVTVTGVQDDKTSNLNKYTISYEDYKNLIATYQSVESNSGENNDSMLNCFNSLSNGDINGAISALTK